MTLLCTNEQILTKFASEVDKCKHTLATMQKYKDDPTIQEAIKTLVKDIETECGKNLYLTESCRLINEFKWLLKQPIRHGHHCNTTKRKLEIYSEYGEIVSRWIRNKQWKDLSVPESTDSPKYVCLVCQSKDETETKTDEMGKKICTICSSEIQTLEIGNTHLDYNRASIVGKFIYNRVLHFQDCIKQFQGKQNCKIPPCVYKDLDVKFNNYRLLIDSDNHHVKYSKITKQHILMFLKELKYVKHYENVNVIYSTLTNKSVDDIGHLEQQLVEDFKELVTLYDNLHSKDKPEELERKNFLNVQYLLFQLLRRHGYDCKIEDFSILKTSDRKLFHDKICCNLFQQLGWNFTPTF